MGRTSAPFSTVGNSNEILRFHAAARTRQYRQGRRLQVVAGLLTAHGLVGTEGRLIEKETARVASQTQCQCAGTGYARPVPQSARVGIRERQAREKT
eukprot:scaffold13433_cov108-Isochrysis_galbana.AAC.1